MEMIKISKCRPVVAAGLAIFVTATAAALPSAPASAAAKPAETASCEALPQVSWWGNLSHNSTIEYVQRRYEGDWSPYIKKWQRYHANMQRLHEEGKIAIVKSRDLRLDGKALKDYADKIGSRLGVIECLASEAETAGAKNLENFPTAAGGPAASLPRPTVIAGNVYQISGNDIDLEIRSSCRNGQAAFRVTNTGTAWPKSGRFELFESDGTTPMIERQLRLRAGQSVTFTTRAEVRTGGLVSLAVEPSWRGGDDRHKIGINCQAPIAQAEVTVTTG